jgi:hypothetical protein
MKKSMMIIAALLIAGSAAAQSRETTIYHQRDGSTTTVRTDDFGTEARRSNGGSHQTGARDNEAHNRMVRDHREPGDRVVRNK